MLKAFHRAMFLLLVSFGAFAEPAQGHTVVTAHQQHIVMPHPNIADIAEMPDEHVQESGALRDASHRFE